MSSGYVMNFSKPAGQLDINRVQIDEVNEQVEEVVEEEEDSAAR